MMMGSSQSSTTCTDGSSCSSPLPNYTQLYVGGSAPVQSGGGSGAAGSSAYPVQYGDSFVLATGQISGQTTSAEVVVWESDGTWDVRPAEADLGTDADATAVVLVANKVSEPTQSGTLCDGDVVYLGVPTGSPSVNATVQDAACEKANCWGIMQGTDATTGIATWYPQFSYVTELDRDGVTYNSFVIRAVSGTTEPSGSGTGQPIPYNTPIAIGWAGSQFTSEGYYRWVTQGLGAKGNSMTMGEWGGANSVFYAAASAPIGVPTLPTPTSSMQCSPTTTNCSQATGAPPVCASGSWIECDTASNQCVCNSTTGSSTGDCPVTVDAQTCMSGQCDSNGCLNGNTAPVCDASSGQWNCDASATNRMLWIVLGIVAAGLGVLGLAIWLILRKTSTS